MVVGRRHVLDREHDIAKAERVTGTIAVAVTDQWSTRAETAESHRAGVIGRLRGSIAVARSDRASVSNSVTDRERVTSAERSSITVSVS
jgi:hypothetical protein